MTSARASAKAPGYPHWALHFTSHSFRLSLGLPQNPKTAGEYFIPRHRREERRLRVSSPGTDTALSGLLEKTIEGDECFQEPGGEPTERKAVCQQPSLKAGTGEREGPQELFRLCWCCRTEPERRSISVAGCLQNMEGEAHLRGWPLGKEAEPSRSARCLFPAGLRRGVVPVL